LTGPLEVTPENREAGDEARLMASKLGRQGWPVIQARKRVEGLEFLSGNFPELDFVLLEDGHQTGLVGRHLDVVILDAWHGGAEDPSGRVRPLGGPTFPFGPYRESLQGLERADILLVESSHSVPRLSTGGQLVASFERVVTLRKVSPEEGAASLPQDFAGLSGIARHGSFENSVTKACGRAPSLAIRLRDHQKYDPVLAQRVNAALEVHGLSTLVTTAKDWIKLEPYWQSSASVWVADLEIRWGQQNVLPQLVREHVDGLDAD
jgi:tetraacyldisaccharide-1-P 4'-kinase